MIDLVDRRGVELATVTGEIDLATPTGRLIARMLGAGPDFRAQAATGRTYLLSGILRCGRCGRRGIDEAEDGGDAFDHGQVLHDGR